MSSSRLRQCPYCHQNWPGGSEDHDLRGFRWIDPLPRNITVSNGDLLLHDGSTGRDRFLAVEVKMPWEPPTQSGQGWLLRGLARAGWTVRLLRGRLGKLTMHRVSPSAVETEGQLISPAAFRSSAVDFLNGQPWRDPSGLGSGLVLPIRASHTHGYAQRGDAFVCVQDYYAIGQAPESGCGDVWTPPA